MANKIVFRYDSMNNAVTNINNIAEQYKTAASTFQQNFAASTAAWEGESKTKMISFIDGAVMEYLGKSVPEVLTALAELLRVNAETMQKTDAEIAANIPQNFSN